MKTAKSIEAQKRQQSILINLLLAFICFAWTIPTLGLLISSFRTRDDIAKSGWWDVLPHREWTTKETLDLGRGTPVDKPINVKGDNVTDDELRAGVMLSNGQQAKWDSRRARTISIQEMRWAVNWNFTTDNYQNVLTGQQFKIKQADGTEKVEVGEDIGRSFLNTLTVSIPATIIPILIAAFAAYAFAWMKFPLKKIMFAGIVALLVVPLQTAMIPMLKDFKTMGIVGSFLSVWLAHTTFGLPLATYLLYNYISQLPGELFESAAIDGASHFQIFRRLVLPLSVPALASFAIFQFLWVWNDLLVALVYLGTDSAVATLPARLNELVGTKGESWHLLTAAAFVTMVVPLIVFLGLQRYFVRGLTTGSVKG